MNELELEILQKFNRHFLLDRSIPVLKEIWIAVEEIIQVKKIFVLLLFILIQKLQVVLQGFLSLV